ncbi:ABC transporter ATP-binding protein [Sphingomonas panacis]|uniref:ABC transporter ATP-binding protein n=2 Tax=Sphingomonas panacis TaxID=1560345 RepID=A0A1B3ZGY8_9SPHN|nr:ABC transporter ATP-binding protein [Sphingomonas panacis]AOH86700.1 ABC transporter ATP-binding protein [Sphingomonas panacis]
MTNDAGAHLPIEVRALRHSYGEREVLCGLDLTVAPGEIYALLGGNGAGKSTTLSALLGFIVPSAGSVRVGGIDPAADPAMARAQLAYVPESVALYDHLSARENLDYFLSLARAQRSRKTVVEPALDAVGLPHHAWNQRVGGFSKGMRQKVAIALALARHVPVLLLDEPTSGLDPRATMEFNRLIETARDRKVAILMVTHDLLSAVDVANRIGFLSAGRIEEELAAGDGAARFDLNALHARYTGTRAAA